MNECVRRATRGEAGFSIVEGLVAALILLIVVLGVLPLISQSMLYNLQGLDATTEANAADDGLDTLLPLDVNAPELLLPVASTSLVATDLFNRYKNEWTDDTTVQDLGNIEFLRTVTLERFDVADLQTEGDNTFDTPLEGSAALDNKTARFRRLRVHIDNERRDGTAVGLTRLGGYDVTTVKVW